MLLKKSLLGWIIVIVITIFPLIPWLFSANPISNHFTDTYNTLRSIGQMLSLTGVTMFSLSIALSTRMRFLEDYFGGMNKVYVAHHLFGGIALILLLFHPLFIASSLIPYSVKAAALYLLPGNDWSINFGISALLLLMSLLILTFFVNLPYQVWRFTHKFLGLAFFIASIHGFYAPSDLVNNTFIKLYLACILLLGLISFTYKTLLGRFLIKKYAYTVTEVKGLQDNVIEISLSSDDEKIDYSPGQFVFLSFIGNGVSYEVHPFSISSTKTDAAVRFTVKPEGDYTKTLHNLKPGDKAFLEGSFGRFLYDKVENNKQIWVAGGIGITPFISMVRSLLPQYIVDLYYSVRTEQEAVYLSDFLQIAKENQNFRVIPYYSKTQGRLTGKTIEQMSDDIVHKDIFICGPPPMMKSLRKQLIELHIPNNHIHSEEFNLL